jgi:D-sedoheptulose 7-phosphate isomerase
MTASEHLDAARRALDALDLGQIARFAVCLTRVLRRDGRVLVAGNGGSAAHTQHLTAELVGRYRDTDRRACSAIALHADTSSLTAVANDFGWDDVFSRQVRAHGRRGDAFVAISTSGASANLLRAADAARECGIAVLALTGPVPNALAERADVAIAVEAASTPTVQEMQQIVIHLLCEAVDDAFRCVHP